MIYANFNTDRIQKQAIIAFINLSPKSYINNNNFIVIKHIQSNLLVTTSIKQELVLCDLNFHSPSQCISYQSYLY